MGGAFFRRGYHASASPLGFGTATSTGTAFRLTPFVRIAFHDAACPSLTRWDCQSLRCLALFTRRSDTDVAPCGGLLRSLCLQPDSCQESGRFDPRFPRNITCPLPQYDSVRQYDIVGSYPTHPVCNYRRLLCRMEDGGPINCHNPVVSACEVSQLGLLPVHHTTL